MGNNAGASSAWHLPSNTSSKDTNTTALFLDFNFAARQVPSRPNTIELLHVPHYGANTTSSDAVFATDRDTEACRKSSKDDQ